MLVSDRQKTMQQMLNQDLAKQVGTHEEKCEVFLKSIRDSLELMKDQHVLVVSEAGVSAPPQDVLNYYKEADKHYKAIDCDVTDLMTLLADEEKPKAA